MSNPIDLAPGQKEVTAWGTLKHRKPAIDRNSQEDIAIQLVSQVAFNDLNKLSLDLIQNISCLYPKWKRNDPLLRVKGVSLTLYVAVHSYLEGYEGREVRQGNLSSYLIGRKGAKIEEGDARSLDLLEQKNDELRRVERLLNCCLKID